MNNLPVKAGVKVIREATKVATVYFPGDGEWMDQRTVKKWLRARGFSATADDWGHHSRTDYTPSGTRSWKPYAFARLVKKTEVHEAFSGASLVTADACVTPADLLAMFELLLDGFKPFRRADRPLPELRLKATRRGFAHTRRLDPWFSVPQWVLGTCEEYVLYYMAHELAHHAFGGISHGLKMNAVEKALLDPHGIAIEYRGGEGQNNPWYPARLFRPNGDTICQAQGRKVPVGYRVVSPKPLPVVPGVA